MIRFPPVEPSPIVAPIARGVLLLALLLAVCPPQVSAGTIPADESRIIKVTVYRDRAEIVRQSTVGLPAGLSSVRFAGIPYDVDPDTIRVSARGVPATLGAVEILEIVEEPRETPEWRAALDELQRLNRDIEMIGEEQTVDKQLRAFLTSLGKVSAEQQTRDLHEGRANPEAINGIYELMDSRLRSLGKNKLDRKDRLRELTRQTEMVDARLETLRPATGIRSRAAVVNVETDRSGELTLQLAYLAPNATWRPTYNVTLDSNTGEVALIVEGVVRQDTGEDWSEVEMHLTSASPARGLEPPRLTSLRLKPHREKFTDRSALASAATENFPVPGRTYQSTLTLSPGAESQEPRVFEATEAAGVGQSEVARSAYNVVFGVPGVSTVPADGRDHRVALRRESLDSTVVYRVAPGLDDRAYLTAVTTSPRDYPLLAGVVRAYAGGSYLGAFALEETGPGVEWTIPFGVDNRIEVVRVPEPGLTSREGLSGKQRQLYKQERTIVHNLTQRDVTLVVEDRLPVSEDERIVVQVAKSTTPGYKNSDRRPGVKLWTLDLAAGDRREIALDYTVRYPREIDLRGLN